ncbi:MAG TPA: ferredoxin--NADP reductase [Pusillimonas sp.]|uniref:ferredoxin--NADP reductase n=1 Tax=Pusillimonas sp. TaxID=3040095 RepID=UPI002B4ADED0|nr:ferredoxin--NADP reductase [Pusillimonas sp.]HLU20753.1 ferredoxin--NADP reductase [Pusillimonas sp.]
MSDLKYTRETVLEVRSWVPGKLLSIVTTRSPAFDFVAGQFARLGLPADDTPHAAPTIWRAYSMVTAPHQREHMEFYSIVVPEGEFSPRLAALKVGDAIYVDKTAFGFLTLERFAPEADISRISGGDLWLLATGTGLSAYLSLLHDPATWKAFDNIVLIHGVRQVEELAYRDQILHWVEHGHPQLAGSSRPAKLRYLPIPTREPFGNMPQARLTQLIQNGQLEELAGLDLDPDRSKVMLCGNPDMLTEARALLKPRGFAVGRRGNPGNLALENYW